LRVLLRRQQSPLIPLSFIALLLIIYSIGLGRVHLFDWDEINFAECAREMRISGEYRYAQIGFLPFWEKPPLFFLDTSRFYGPMGRDGVGRPLA
jgi:4-amino-4-deoxy-L-arabinose transferase-like glycosyltransferase